MKIVSENRFSGKTYFETIGPWHGGGLGVCGPPGCLEEDEDDFLFPLRVAPAGCDPEGVALALDPLEPMELESDSCWLLRSLCEDGVGDASRIWKEREI